MYVLIVYDVGVEKVVKVHQYLKRYLTWIQNSVFEGEIGEADFLTIKKKLRILINIETDSILIFQAKSKHVFEKQIIGTEKNETGTII